MTDFKFDLLGDPYPEGFGKRGRPPHLPDAQKRKVVIVLQAFGWSNEDIAAALSITEPTLRKHYFRELKIRADARSRVEAKLLAELMAQVENGNVQAIEKMFKRIDKMDLREVAKSLGGKAPKQEQKLGKKEQRRLESGDVMGVFAPPAPPKNPTMQ